MKTSQKGQGLESVKIESPVMCPADAFIKREEYVLSKPARGKDKKTSDMLFREWQAQNAIKYIRLLNSYDLLRECWEYSHPKEKK